MTPPPLPDELLATLPPAVRAYLRALETVAAGLADQVARLTARVAELEHRLGQTSANSSKPPSSDGPHVKPAPPKTPSGMAKGGQPGHPRNDRPRLPPDAVVELRPAACPDCRHALAGDDPDPVVHQVVELPPVRPHVTEYRRHRLACPRCGRVACAELPADASSGYGPRVQAVAALLSGAYRVGKRGVARLMGDVLGVPISPAGVCGLQRKIAAALGPVAAEAQAHVAGRPVSVDETSWRQARNRVWLWVAVTATLTVFLIRPSRGRKVLGELAPGEIGVATTDRYGAYAHLDPGRRQVCWAHLRRDFQAMIDRADAGSTVGRGLLLHADILLAEWKRVRDGVLARSTFQSDTLAWLRPEVATLLAAGAAGDGKTAGVCASLRGIEAGLYTFATTDGVEPTNNAAERALRHAVCWRKTSGGTDGESGSRFVERVLTVVATCRQQNRDVLAVLIAAVQAARTGTTPPSLLPAGP